MDAYLHGESCEATAIVKDARELMDIFRAQDGRVMLDMTPPATARDRYMFEQGRQAERDPRTHAIEAAQPEMEAIAAVKTLNRLGYTWRGGELWAPPLGPIPDRFTARSDLPDALNAMGDAIEHALGQCALTDVLPVITGTFVGLTVELLKRNGHDPETEIKIDGGDQRDITIHTPKGERGVR